MNLFLSQIINSFHQIIDAQPSGRIAMLQLPQLLTELVEDARKDSRHFSCPL
jgi:hypothetical protein